MVFSWSLGQGRLHDGEVLSIVVINLPELVVMSRMKSWDDSEIKVINK